MYFVNLTLIFLFLMVCVYFDLKDRIIPNKFLKLYLLITFILIPFDVYYYLDIILWYIFIKILVLIFIFILVLTLFTLKLLGGGDGKVLILLFHSFPFMYIFYFLQYFFLIFSLFLIIAKITIYIPKAKIKNNEKSDILTKAMNSILYDDIKIRPKSKDFSLLRKRHIFPLLIPIFFSYITLTIWILFIL